MKIRKALPADYDEVWKIFHNIVKEGDTYVYDPNTTKDDFVKLWFAENMKTYVAEINGDIFGTYFIKPNQIDLGSHIANAGYMVHPTFHGKGVGGAMCEHSIKTSKEFGYKAMQFNFVVSTNENAIKLWKKHGFKIIGTIPKAFHYKKERLVDAYIMYREL